MSVVNVTVIANRVYRSNRSYTVAVTLDLLELAANLVDIVEYANFASLSMSNSDGSLQEVADLADWLHSVEPSSPQNQEPR